MDNVAKQFGCNLNLGKTFWATLSNIVFTDKMSKYPLMRVALALGNLTSNKVEDGVARLLERSDIKKVTSKPMAPKVKLYESTLSDALRIVDTISRQADCLNPLGKLFSRVALLATNKDKLGVEKKSYTLEEIQQLFLQDVSKLVGTPVMFEAWTGGQSDGDGPKEHDAQKSLRSVPKVASLSDHTDPTWIASQAGFEIGGTVVEKGQEQRPDSLYALFKIEDDLVYLLQLCSYAGDPIQVQLPMTTFLSNWSKSKAEPPIHMIGGNARSKAIFVDIVKCDIFKALIAADKEKPSAKKSLEFWRRPDEARTSKAIDAWQLALIPVTPLSSISTKVAGGNPQSLGHHAVDDDGNTCEFFAFPPSRPPFKASQSEFSEEAVVAAYWWVSTTSHQSKANMECGVITKHGIDIPVLHNPKPIAPYTKLCLFKAKATAAALGGGKIISPSAAADEPSSAKKQKTS